MSGWHPDAKVLPELLQEQEGEHSVRDEADARRKEALGEEEWWRHQVQGDPAQLLPYGSAPLPQPTLKKACGPSFAVSMAQWKTPYRESEGHSNAHQMHRSTPQAGGGHGGSECSQERDRGRNESSSGCDINGTEE